MVGWLAAELCPTLCHPMDCRPPGFSVHGTLQAGMLEWVAMTVCQGDLPDPGTEPGSPALAGGFLSMEPPGKHLCLVLKNSITLKGDPVPGSSHSSCLFPPDPDNRCSAFCVHGFACSGGFLAMGSHTVCPSASASVAERCVLSVHLHCSLHQSVTPLRGCEAPLLFMAA